MRFLLTTVCVLLLSASVHTFSQEPPLSDAQLELGLRLARTTVNESGWQSAADLDLIWQTTQQHGRTSEARIEWLKLHSSCVNGESAPEPGSTGNCEWTWHLTRDGEEPANFPMEWDNFRSRWANILRTADRRVRHNRARRVCRVNPDTWGGPMDHHRAVHRGMIPLNCRGTLNEGYVYERNASRLDGIEEAPAHD